MCIKFTDEDLRFINHADERLHEKLKSDKDVNSDQAEYIFISICIFPENKVSEVEPMLLIHNNSGIVLQSAYKDELTLFVKDLISGHDKFSKYDVIFYY